VKPVRKRVIRAVVLALMVLALTANVAAANEGGGYGLEMVPYDPGLPDQAPLAPPSWRFFD
jgi:hypothetical protein